jgi:hypothetical protein
LQTPTGCSSTSGQASTWKRYRSSTTYLPAFPLPLSLSTYPPQLPFLRRRLYHKPPQTAAQPVYTHTASNSHPTSQRKRMEYASIQLTSPPHQPTDHRICLRVLRRQGQGASRQHPRARGHRAGQDQQPARCRRRFVSPFLPLFPLPSHIQNCHQHSTHPTFPSSLTTTPGSHHTYW